MKGQTKLFAAVLFLLVVVGLSAAQGPVCINPQSGMVAWWTGDNTTADFLGLSNGLAASPVDFTAGEVGSGFSLNGSQYMQIPRTDQLESMTTAISVGAWVRGTAPGNFAYIFSKGASSIGGASYALYTGANGGLIFYISDGTNFYLSPDAGTAIWDGNFHHVVGTYDGSTVRLFVDGQEVAGALSAPNVTIGYGLSISNDAFVGAFGGNSFFFAGEVDEIVVFNRALTPAEILASFNANAAGLCKVVTPLNTGARGQGFWQNKNGQGMIAGGASTGGVCNSGTWLRQYAPFQDLSSTASCSTVASYAYTVVKGATGGPNMNAKLKSQMLATAMSVYFSDPALGGNLVKAPTPIGGVAIKVAGNVAFGGAIGMTVSQMLAYAAGLSNVGGSTWYANVRTVQEQAKDAFDSINSGTAFAP